MFPHFEAPKKGVDEAETGPLAQGGEVQEVQKGVPAMCRLLARGTMSRYPLQPYEERRVSEEANVAAVSRFPWKKSTVVSARPLMWRCCVVAKEEDTSLLQ